MFKFILGLLVFINALSLHAKNEVSGIVTDKKGNPIIGVNVYLDGTYDGSTSDTQGVFAFETTETGMQTLVVSFISFETKKITNEVNKLNNLKIQLKDDINTLNSVVLSGSTFSAGDNSKAAALKPIDIVTTAGAAGDVIAAFQTLPGTTTVAEDGRLFVRGGAADESNIYIDGLKVFKPFLETGNGAPTRGRYSPFLFDGISFSTGGYSVEYGDALSSVLELNTTSLANKEQADFSLMSLGAGASGTKKWKNSSLIANGLYINLKPYQKIVNSNIEWKKPYESLSGEAVYKQQLKKGIFKVYGGYSFSDLAFVQPDINVAEGIDIALKNRNIYGNVSYKGDLGKQWKLTAGSSISSDDKNTNFDNIRIKDNQTSAHLKLKLNKRFSNYFKLKFGTEQFLDTFNETGFFTDGDDTFSSSYTNNNNAMFAETEIFFNQNLAMKAGLRATNHSLLKEGNISPRVSLAYKTGAKSQVSMSYGDFYQTPTSDILKFDTSLSQQKASHYIVNYLYQHKGKTFRVEAYRKDYDNLVKYNTETPQFNSEFNNLGYGKASGLDLFWRDDKSIKNLEYWVSYSYIDTKRDYANFSEEATPNFAPKHNASFVTKYWIKKWKSQLGMTYTYASGRPYDNPNIQEFMNETTRRFQNLSFSWAYLMSQKKILFLSISNVPNFSNVFGYQYANELNTNGSFDRRGITPTSDRFIMLGFFWTISKDKNENQLKNL